MFSSLGRVRREDREQASEVRCQLKVIYKFILKITSITNVLSQDYEKKRFVDKMYAVCGGTVSE